MKNVLVALRNVMFWEGIGCLVMLMPGIIVSELLSAHLVALMFVCVWILAVIMDWLDTYRHICDFELNGNDNRNALEEVA